MDVALNRADAAFESGHADLARDLAIDALNALSNRPHLVYHPLGFLKYIYAFDGDRRLQLHIWHPRHSRPQIPRQTCHSHGYRLNSYIICGELLDHYYELTQDLGGDHLIYTFGYEGSGHHAPHGGAATSRSHLSGATRYSARELQAIPRVTGTFYSIAPDAFHWTDSTDVTATLSGGRIADARLGRIVRRKDHPADLAYERAAVPTKQAKEIVAEIRERF